MPCLHSIKHFQPPTGTEYDNRPESDLAEAEIVKVSALNTLNTHNRFPKVIITPEL